MTPDSTKVEKIRSDLQAEASQLRAELWGLCNGSFAPGAIGPMCCEQGDEESSSRRLSAELLSMTRERDAAWARCEALESKLEIERLTARVCATEAVEVQATCEERRSELLEELTAAEAENVQLRQLVKRQDFSATQSSLLREIHSKVLASLYHWEELKQQLHAANGGSSPGQQLQRVRGSAMTPLQPCDWFETQGTSCSHQRQLSDLTERLRLSNDELHECDSDRIHWARRAQELQKTVEELKLKLANSEEQTAMMLQEHAQVNEKRRETAEELAELRAVCQQLESAASQAVDLHGFEDLSSRPAPTAPTPGTKLKHAIRCEPLTVPESAAKPLPSLFEPLARRVPVPMLPPPKVVRVVEQRSPATTLASLPPSREAEAGPASTSELPLKNFQSFLDASVDGEPQVHLRSSLPFPQSSSHF
eukprot:s689_g41.t1